MKQRFVITRLSFSAIVTLLAGLPVIWFLCTDETMNEWVLLLENFIS